MTQPSSDTAGTPSPPSCAQLLSVFGVLLIIVGAWMLIGELIQDSRNSITLEPIRVVADASIMLCGILLTAVGQALTALRSIARTCGTNAQKH
jgi:uncharacterized membrane protein YccF (DUF307 family)